MNFFHFVFVSQIIQKYLKNNREINNDPFKTRIEIHVREQLVKFSKSRKKRERGMNFREFSDSLLQPSQVRFEHFLFLDFLNKEDL